VTGAASAVGFATSVLLAERGYRVYAGADQAADLALIDAEATKRDVRVQTVPVDLTDPATIEAVVARIEADNGAVYGLVNCAGQSLGGCLEDLTELEIRQIFDVNVFGTMALTQRVLPSMRTARRGRVVTITSIGGRIGTLGRSADCAAKFALEGFAEALSLEIAPFGLRSVIVEPGILPTSDWAANRGTATSALNPASPYRNLFEGHQATADRQIDRWTIQPIDVAAAVDLGLSAPHPRLRYVVGAAAKRAVLLRRYLPNRVFEQLYAGFLGSHLPSATRSLSGGGALTP
jgi:NAD(P)-dependent dehydrogenase (short-subunit alcohol dehydrogenase family)